MRIQQLTDFTVEHTLLENSGTTLLVFTSQSCSHCRYVSQALPKMALGVEQLAWVDAGENGGAVAQFEVFHLPSFYLVRDGEFYGQVACVLEQSVLVNEIQRLLQQPAQDLP